jgi:hypothetical protein
VKRLALTILIVFVFAKGYSQEENPIKQGSTTEQQLENLTEQQESETEDDNYLQYLVQARRNRLNLNTVDEGELKDLRLVTDLQIQNLISYRRLLGNLISVYELQAVPTWDVETIQKILPYVTVGNPVGEDVGRRFTGGQHSIVARLQQTLEKSVGFTRPDTIANRYPGSPQRLFFRYKYNYRNLLQFGLVGDKDPGEQLFKGGQKNGFDFYSFHLFARKLGPIKLLALGDFTVNLGQGLIHWQSLAFKKSADVLAVKRQAEILRPYSSAGEFNFERGVGVTVGGRKVDVTAFGSVRKLDATFHTDTSQTNEDFISSILNSGYHRTPSEVAKKNSFTQTTFGGNISYHDDRLHVGLNGVAYQFSTPLVRDIQPYNQYSIQGKEWYNYSVDYSYTFRNLHFFGEAAMDKTSSTAFLNGLLVSIDPKVDASVVYRNIEKSYQTLYGNAFTEGTYPTNEKGLYTGISIRPNTVIRIDAYADVFSFPWLRYRVDAPTTGTEYLVQLTYHPNKQVEAYTRYKNENKAINISGSTLPTNQPYITPRQNWRTQISYSPNRQFSLRHRVELVWYAPGEEGRSQQGFLTYIDAGFKPRGTQLSLNGRLQYFETDGFDSRLYAFESDVLYSYSIPQFIGKGLRYYVNVNYNVTKKMEVWLRWAQTIYQNQNTIGSGLDLINGDRRSEVKFQVMYNF